MFRIDCIYYRSKAPDFDVHNCRIGYETCDGYYEEREIKERECENCKKYISRYDDKLCHQLNRRTTHLEQLKKDIVYLQVLFETLKGDKK